MKPTIGRVVHYQAHGSPNGQHKSEPRAAIITRVASAQEPHDPDNEAQHVVDLCVLNPSGMFFNQAVPFSQEPKAGCWSWPPRV